MKTTYCDDVSDLKRILFSCREISFSASNNAGGYAERFIANNIKYNLYFIDFCRREEKSVRVGDLTWPRGRKVSSQVNRKS